MLENNNSGMAGHINEIAKRLGNNPEDWEALMSQDNMIRDCYMYIFGHICCITD